MNSVGKRPVRTGIAEHVLRRFFDLFVLIALSVFVGLLWWNQQNFQVETTAAQGGIDVDSIVTISNTDTDAIAE